MAQWVKDLVLWLRSGCCCVCMFDPWNFYMLHTRPKKDGGVGGRKERFGKENSWGSTLLSLPQSEVGGSIRSGSIMSFEKCWRSSLRVKQVKDLS